MVIIHPPPENSLPEFFPPWKIFRRNFTPFRKFTTSIFDGPMDGSRPKPNRIIIHQLFSLWHHGPESEPNLLLQPNLTKPNLLLTGRPNPAGKFLYVLTLRGSSLQAWFGGEPNPLLTGCPHAAGQFHYILTIRGSFFPAQPCEAVSLRANPVGRFIYILTSKRKKNWAKGKIVPKYKKKSPNRLKKR